MKKLGATFGIRDCDLESAREQIQRILGVQFEGHESSYWGEYYLAKTASGESVQLAPNRNEAEEELNEPDFPDVLLLVNVTDILDDDRLAQLRRALEADGRISLLKTVEY